LNFEIYFVCFSNKTVKIEHANCVDLCATVMRIVCLSVILYHTLADYRISCV